MYRPRRTCLQRRSLGPAFPQSLGQQRTSYKSQRSRALCAIVQFNCRAVRVLSRVSSTVHRLVHPSLKRRLAAAMLILGVEGSANKLGEPTDPLAWPNLERVTVYLVHLGVGIVRDDGTILANVRDTYITPPGGKSRKKGVFFAVACGELPACFTALHSGFGRG